MRSTVCSRAAMWFFAAACVSPVVSIFARAVDAEVSPPPVTLAVSGRANATPSIASDGDVVVVAWGASLPSGATDVFLAVSRNGHVALTDRGMLLANELTLSL